MPTDDGFDRWHFDHAAACCDHCRRHCEHEPWERAAWQAATERAARVVESRELIPHQPNRTNYRDLESIRKELVAAIRGQKE